MAGALPDDRYAFRHTKSTRSKDASSLLADLATGLSSDFQTKEAKTALDRIAKRPGHLPE